MQMLIAREGGRETIREDIRLVPSNQREDNKLGGKE